MTLVNKKVTDENDTEGQEAVIRSRKSPPFSVAASYQMSTTRSYLILKSYPNVEEQYRTSNRKWTN